MSHVWRSLILFLHLQSPLLNSLFLQYLLWIFRGSSTLSLALPFRFLTLHLLLASHAFLLSCSLAFDIALLVEFALCLAFVLYLVNMYFTNIMISDKPVLSFSRLRSVLLAWKRRLDFSDCLWKRSFEARQC